AEISRYSIWQLIHNETTLCNGKPVTKELFREMLAEELRVIQDVVGELGYSSGGLVDADRLMEHIST
ncbi:malate synthase A, partial [Salmonella enterica subsp. enterica serovar Infantis]